MNNEEKITEVKEILKNTNVNTLVIDAKTDNGHIMFDSGVPEVTVLNNERIKYDAESLNALRGIKEIYQAIQSNQFKEKSKSLKEMGNFQIKK